MTRNETAETGNAIKAVILDLDGVITHTARLHNRAWKEMFDSFLRDYAQRTGSDFKPMDPGRDYREYIDGRLRYDGARAFLESRNIHLPFGKASDGPEAETVCGLSNRKNLIYLALLHKHGPEVYDDTIAMVKKWREERRKTAVISASKNCREVLSTAGITGLFDAVVDGVDSAKNNLKGKPAPDIFLFAARKLGVDPSEAAIVEDSSAGVRAGKDGDFAYVIGVSRNGDPGLLYRSGADVVVSLLTEAADFGAFGKRTVESIPSALEHFDEIADWLRQRRLFLVLDYDGTLTPIVARPELATLSQEMRWTIRDLAAIVKVAIVSGRDLMDVKTLVGVDAVYYAGSHGFDIQGPGPTRMEPEAARPVLPDLDEAERKIRSRLSEIPGLQIERKRFMLTVHYRNVAEENVPAIKEIMKQTATGYDRLTTTSGKKVLELRPAIEWHKGKAVSWMAGHLFEASDRILPLYIGDDVTDEDAFREIKGRGISILVGSHGDTSYADYQLADPGQVLAFLELLAKTLNSFSSK